MHKVEKFSCKDDLLSRLLSGRQIACVNYMQNHPIEENCVSLEFSDESELLIYTILRVIENDRIVLCSSDYYLHKDYTADENPAALENTLMDISLTDVNRKIRGSIIKNISLNEQGDLVLFLNNSMQIQIFIDSMEDGIDYYCFYTDKTYYALRLVNCRLIRVYGEIEDEE